MLMKCVAGALDPNRSFHSSTRSPQARNRLSVRRVTIAQVNVAVLTVASAFSKSIIAGFHSCDRARQTMGAPPVTEASFTPFTNARAVRPVHSHAEILAAAGVRKSRSWREIGIGNTRRKTDSSTNSAKARARPEPSAAHRFEHDAQSSGESRSLVCARSIHALRPRKSELMT